LRYRRTFTYQLRKTNKPKKSKAKSQALVVRRIIDERGRYTGDAIDIISPRLCNVLLDINEDVEGLFFSPTKPEVSKLTFSNSLANPIYTKASTELMFYSYPGLLSRLASEQQNNEAKDEGLIRDIKAAILVIEEDQRKTLRDLEQLLHQKQITFELLWALFTPNCLVYNHHVWTAQDRVLLSRYVAYGRSQKTGKRYLNITCDIIHDDGESFGFAREDIEIQEFHGARSILDLVIYPLKCREDKEAVYAQAVKQGKTLAQMKMHSYNEVDGQAVRQGKRTEKIEKFYVRFGWRYEIDDVF
jgi:hypothetical protein